MSSRARMWIMLVLLLPGILAGCRQQAQEPTVREIFIASANPMTGHSGDSGQMKVMGIELALAEANSSGGINGKTVRLVVGDDASSPKIAHALAEKLVADYRIAAVIGHWNSANMLAARNVYNGAGIPVLTDSVKKIITDGTTPYIFRILPSDQSEAEQIADYCVKQLKLRRMAIIYVNNDYSTGMKDYFRDRFRQNGGYVTDSELYFEGRTTDFTAELEKIKNSQPQGVFIAGYYNEAAEIAKQAKALGMHVPLICPNGANSDELIRLGGSAVEGLRVTGFYHRESRQEGAQKFAAAFRSRYGKEPDTFAALAYDSANILLQAIAAAGGNREGIYQYLQQFSGYNGISGTIRFNSRREADIPLVFLIIKNGQIVEEQL